MARTSDIDVLETAFLVGKRRPISEFPAWKRWVIRGIYFVLGWDNGAAVEVQAICTTAERAREMAIPDGWFLIELPINVSLPEEPCQFKVHEFPQSDVQDQSRRVPLAAVPVDHIKELERQTREMLCRIRAS